jgi:hypothetical protein
MMVQKHNHSMNFKKLIAYFGYFMVLFYLSAGIMLLIPNVEIGFLNHIARMILGIALLIYGIFRAWRVYKINQNENAD